MLRNLLIFLILLFCFPQQDLRADWLWAGELSWQALSLRPWIKKTPWASKAIREECYRLPNHEDVRAESRRSLKAKGGSELFQEIWMDSLWFQLGQGRRHHYIGLVQMSLAFRPFSSFS